MGTCEHSNGCIRRGATVISQNYWVIASYFCGCSPCGPVTDDCFHISDPDPQSTKTHRVRVTNRCQASGCLVLFGYQSLQNSVWPWSRSQVIHGSNVCSGGWPHHRPPGKHTAPNRYLSVLWPPFPSLQLSASIFRVFFCLCGASGKCRAHCGQATLGGLDLPLEDTDLP